MTIVEMLRKEADNIEKNYIYKSFIREDVTDMMISVCFANKEYHHILPRRKGVMKVLVQELKRLLNPIALNESRAKHERSKIPDFVNVGEMEI